MAKDPNGTAEITKPEFEDLIKKDLNMNVDSNDKFNDILNSSSPNVDFQTFIDFLMPPASGSSSSSAAVAGSNVTNIPSASAVSTIPSASAVSTIPSASPPPLAVSTIPSPPSSSSVYLIVQKTGDEIKEKTDPITVTGFTDDIFAIRITPGVCPTPLGDKQVCFEYDGKDYIVEWGLTETIADVQAKPLKPEFLETSAVVATSGGPLATTSATTSGGPLATTSATTSGGPLSSAVDTLNGMDVLRNYINMKEGKGTPIKDIFDEVNKQRNATDLETFINKVLDEVFTNTKSSSATHQYALINGVSCDMSRIHLFKDVPLKTQNDELDPVLKYIDTGIPSNERSKYFEESKKLCNNIKDFPDFIFDSVDGNRVSLVKMKDTEKIDTILQGKVEDFVVFTINRVPDIFDRAPINVHPTIGDYNLVSTVLDTVDGNNAYVNYESSPHLHFANGLIKEFKENLSNPAINEDQYNEYKNHVDKWITTRDMKHIDEVIKFHKANNLLEGVDENFALKDKLVSVVLYRKTNVVKGGSRKKRGRKTGTRRKYYVYNK